MTVMRRAGVAAQGRRYNFLLRRSTHQLCRPSSSFMAAIPSSNEVFIRGITRDGQLQPFKGGVMKILEQAAADGLQVPVVPMALTNLWGSYFSRIEKEGAMVRPFRRGVFNRVGLNVGEAVPAGRVTPEGLQARVQHLLMA